MSFGSAQPRYRVSLHGSGIHWYLQKYGLFNKKSMGLILLGLPEIDAG